jgi:hypothetical protein
MARNRRPPSQGWKTFLRNHADGIASLDLFVVPTISFQLLYGLLILKQGRREILCLAATAHPSAEWISRQLMEAYGWEEGPRYLVRDRDRVYGEVFIRRLRAMGIRDRPTAPRSHGRMAIVKDGNALTISWSLASGIFGICFALTPITTIAPERTCP